jgi:hypothetical protein
MSLNEDEIDDLLCEELPEFASAVREHRAEWPDQPGLYPLLGLLFDFVVNESNMVPDARKDVAQRAYAVVEKALTAGDKRLRDCFAIEMIEPLIADPKHKVYPDFESVMGPASKRELHGMREWWKRKHALDDAVRQVHERLGVEVFSGVGQQGAINARAIADVDKWKQLRREDKESAYRTLAESWKQICGSERSKFAITGPRDTGFIRLR